jgi:hypothetical protein
MHQAKPTLAAVHHLARRGAKRTAALVPYACYILRRNTGEHWMCENYSWSNLRSGACSALLLQRWSSRDGEMAPHWGTRRQARHT